MNDELLCSEIKKLCGILQGKTLDVGCGAGDFEDYLLRNGVIMGELIGIDKWNFSLNYAEKRLSRYNISVRCVKMDAENLDFPDETFDNYLAVRMFHEIDNPVRALRESYRILKMNGVCLIIDWKKGADTGVPERYYSLGELITLIKRSTSFQITHAVVKDDYLFIKCTKQ